MFRIAKVALTHKKSQPTAPRAHSSFRANKRPEIRTPKTAIKGMPYLGQKTERSARQRATTKSTPALVNGTEKRPRCSSPGYAATKAAAQASLPAAPGQTQRARAQ